MSDGSIEKEIKKLEAIRKRARNLYEDLGDLAPCDQMAHARHHLARSINCMDDRTKALGLMLDDPLPPCESPPTKQPYPDKEPW